jgi:hypothetical protein
VTTTVIGRLSETRTETGNVNLVALCSKKILVVFATVFYQQCKTVCSNPRLRTIKRLPTQIS